MSPQNDFQNYRPITGCGRSLFIFNGDFNGEMARFEKSVFWDRLIPREAPTFFRYGIKMPTIYIFAQNDEILDRPELV